MIRRAIAGTRFGKAVSGIIRPRSNPVASVPIDDVLRPAGEPFAGLLGAMYAGLPQTGIDGKAHQMQETVRISPSQGMWIFDTCRKLGSESTLEIGMAYGYSTLFFLAAIKANGAGHHTAIDPFEDSAWKGIGRTLVTKSGMASKCDISSEAGIEAMIRFGREKRKFGVVFIDGSHRFDDVLVDFVLAARICEPGGYIVMDDMWMPSIQRAVEFIRNNRPDMSAVATSLSNIAVFQLTGQDDRAWDHFVDFRIKRD